MRGAAGCLHRQHLLLLLPVLLLLLLPLLPGAQMFDTDDPEQFAIGIRVLDCLDAMDGRDGLSYDQEFWEDLGEDAFEFMLWRVKFPGNRKGNNSNDDRTALGRFDWDSHLAKLRALGLFKRYYRMSKERFESLYELLLDDLSRVESKAKNSTEQGPIPPRARLSCVIRWLAGGCYLDLVVIHIMSTTEFYETLKVTLTRINEHPDLKLVFPLGDEERLESIAAGFAATIPGGTHIKRAAGAVDGFQAQVHVPRRTLPSAILP